MPSRLPEPSFRRKPFRLPPLLTSGINQARAVAIVCFGSNPVPATRTNHTKPSWGNPGRFFIACFPWLAPSRRRNSCPIGCRQIPGQRFAFGGIFGGILPHPGRRYPVSAQLPPRGGVRRLWRTRNRPARHASWPNWLGANRLCFRRRHGLRAAAECRSARRSG